MFQWLITTFAEVTKRKRVVGRDPFAAPSPVPPYWIKLKGNSYDFSIDYGIIAIDDILDIHKHLMKKKWYRIKMFGFVKQIFISAIIFFSCNALKYVSMNNQEFKVRPETINININEPSFYPDSVKINKCIGSCCYKNINNLFAKICIPDVVKNINIRVINLIWRTNETRHIKFHKKI